MPGCHYCQIVEGSEPAGVVYEDADLIALTAPQPLHPGHCVIIPREHSGSISGLDPRVATHLWLVALLIERAIASAGMCESGLTMLVGEGPTSGDQQGHVALELVPREFGDAWSALETERPQADQRILDRVARRLRDQLA